MNTPDFIGKRVVVVGYVHDLGSHGYVMANERECEGLLELDVGLVMDSSMWRKAFRNDLVAQRAILSGVVTWKQGRYGGRSPLLTVERLHSLNEVSS